jgi:RHS repeat-associated protein
VKQNKVGTSVISSYDYAVNAIGQRTGVTTSGTAFPAVPSWAWSYDALGQVIAADSSVATSDRSYQYDTIGNRQKSADSLTLPVANNYSANLLNQYSAINNQQSSVINPSYDFDGNATAYPMPAAPTTNSTLAWDAENRLISSTVGTVITTYQYDAKSRRIAKVAGTSATTSTATLYLYDAWNCLAEYERGTGVSPVLTLKKTRLWGTDLSGTPQGAGGVGGLLSESLISNPQSPIYYPTYDGNGNISEYLTATGTTAAHFEYDPFGNTVVNTDTANLFTYRFSTKPRDQEIGVYYYGYRYYDPSTGRWLSRDPIQEKGGVNLYGFLQNNGVSTYDLLGLFVISGYPYIPPVTSVPASPPNCDGKPVGTSEDVSDWAKITSPVNNCPASSGDKSEASMKLTAGMTVGMAKVEVGREDKVPVCKKGWYEAKVTKLCKTYQVFGILWETTGWVYQAETKDAYDKADCSSSN